MNCYEGKYFNGKDFYDWGTDNDILKVSERFNNESFLLEMMLENKPEIFDEEEYKELKGFFDNRCIDLNKKCKDKYIKMIYLNLYIEAEECFAEIYKAICIYNPKFIEMKKVRTSYKEIIEITNNTDMSDLFIDGILENELSGLSSKIREINKLCNNFYGFTINKKDIELLDKFNIERNILVHSNGSVNNKSIKGLLKLGIGKVEIGDSIEYTEKNILDLIGCIRDLIHHLFDEISHFYGNKINLDEI
ncbi:MULTISPECIES: hypothetical protein [Clostridium]|uniref:hypothetical protein n=1 Tax=Clostridium TaxID=1485 RepID=UPI00257A683D|nr:hypothetical protein [Clostridium sp.]MBS4840166.1 hypothetical protein [Clostridium sp.]MDU1401077.1 hypothetical protein [Clostridium sp.]MDU4924727.1 hypothetical protein [Clostridium sp.]